MYINDHLYKAFSAVLTCVGTGSTDEAFLEAEGKTLTWGFLQRKNTSGVGPIWWVSCWCWTNGLFSRKYVCSHLFTGSINVISKTRSRSSFFSNHVSDEMKGPQLFGLLVVWDGVGLYPRARCSGCCPDLGYFKHHGLFLLPPVHSGCQESSWTLSFPTVPNTVLFARKQNVSVS